MKDLLAEAAAWSDLASPTARAVVVRTFGSAPRPEGAALLVSGDGRLAGSVSGGCVEGAAFEEVEKARTTGRSRVIRYGISDEQAWDVGLACGGTIDVLDGAALAPEVVDAARRARAGGHHAAPRRCAGAGVRAARAGGRRPRPRRRSSCGRARA